MALMRDADAALFRWQMRGEDGPPPPEAAAAFKLQEVDEKRAEQIERFRQFGEPYLRDDGTRGNMADLIPAICEMNRQLDLKLPDMTKRAMVRLHLAHAIETKVLPLTDDAWFHGLPERLRAARKDFCIGYRPADGRKRVAWSQKAGLSRMCPDDSRDETGRLNRRLIDPILELKNNGCQVTYAVLTHPNYQPGNLRRGMENIYKRFNATLKKRKNRRPLFPNIVGAMCVLEAPLARDRTWNVHLNVVLVHRGFLDWRALQAAWKWGCHFGRIKGGREELERALREVIKYSARAVAEKSQCPNTSTDGAISAVKLDASAASTCSLADASLGASATHAQSSSDNRSRALPLGEFATSGISEIAGCPSPATASGGPEPTVDTASRLPGDARSGPPAMIDWTGQELLEWLTAFRKFRRTRTYRQLFRLPKPEPDSLAGYLWVGTGEWVESAYRTEVGPLFSIPGDKSTTPDHLERWLKWLSRIQGKPPPLQKRRKSA